MKTTVTVDLNVPGFGQDDRVSSRVIASEGFALVVGRFRANGVASVSFSRDTVSIVLAKVTDLIAVEAMAERVERELREVFVSEKRAAQDEIPTDPRMTKEER